MRKGYYTSQMRNCLWRTANNTINKCYVNFSDSFPEYEEKQDQLASVDGSGVLAAIHSEPEILYSQ